MPSTDIVQDYEEEWEGTFKVGTLVCMYITPSVYHLRLTCRVISLLSRFTSKVLTETLPVPCTWAHLASTGIYENARSSL
jgi:hypothetical protein